MMSIISWTMIVFLAGRIKQFNVRKFEGVCVFGIHKYIHLLNVRTLSEYV